MCGISGFVSVSNMSNSETVIRKMNETIAHRGPDGEGYFVGRGFTFGHRRLSIIDLSDAGHQPMHYLNRYTITYNGEIFNYRELKQELESKGYIFKTQTDTEVLMASYDCWGSECLNKFNGMWAFVIYDQVRNEFFISRDRFGKKPLYYSQTKDAFVFSSDIKGILQFPGIDMQPNLPYLKRYLTLGAKEHLLETAFVGIYKFPHASFLIAKQEDLIGRIYPQIFWRVIPNLSREKVSSEKAKDYAQKYYELLFDSVQLRLRADVKVGSALSGGLDSSSIVYLVNQQLKALGKSELQETFSSVYKSKGTENCDESEYINLLADFLKVNSNQIEPKEEDIPSEHAKLILHMENPPESSCMSGWHTFKKVAETDVTVTLDGQGADEQLAGYLGYLQTYLVSLSISEFYKELPYYRNFLHTRKVIFNLAISNIIRNIVGRKGYLFLFNTLLKKGRYADLNQALVDSTQTSLLNLIAWADRESMAFSIESRMPFMDYRLVEFLASIPGCYKIHKGWTKYIARLAFDKKLPDEIVWRKDKMGWPIPEEHWFRGGLREWFNNTREKSKLLGSLNQGKFTKNVSGLVEQVRELNIAVFEDVIVNQKNA
ncbi:MAG: asparagine synthase (glutamine-hydrolyzing) [Microcystis aeruginosa Ma_AC_P_19900807_S300]|nr:MAG: asparagine synthase (glutamine-hydrolyzing) [Microcystis aeruginosa Ma_AC_P_19900807_S300]